MDRTVNGGEGPRSEEERRKVINPGQMGIAEACGPAPHLNFGGTN